MIKNCSFYEKNVQFSKLIIFYAHKLRDPHAIGELWSFLWICKALTADQKPARYYAVCLRNEYIKMSKSEAVFCPINETIYNKTDEYNLLDISNLSDTEKSLFKALKSGYTQSDFARLKGCSRAAVNSTKKRLAVKLCNQLFL